MLHGEITEAIIGAFFEVHKTLGSGFLEKVYENALAHLLRTRGFVVAQQAPVFVFFKGTVVGEYYADLFVEDKVIVELKTADQIHPIHLAQLSNYLKASQIEVGLLMNFGPRATFKRVLLTNDRKPASPDAPNGAGQL